MNFQDRGIMIAVIVIVLVGGAIFTLWWWRLADKWANAENKRFKKAGLREGAEPKRVVMTGFDKPRTDDQPTR
jgi:cytochrome c biogenesis factor